MSAAVYDLASRRPVDALSMRYATRCARHARTLDNVVHATSPRTPVHHRARHLAAWQAARADACRALAHGDVCQALLMRHVAQQALADATAIKG